VELLATVPTLVLPAEVVVWAAPEVVVVFTLV
jgi:hypothetical protein